jgi:ABC-type multidrug transport system ATPase subunit
VSREALGLSTIEKRFGRLAVLRGVDLAIAGGEIVGLLGANGAGKTTLLNIAAGLLPPTSGERRYFGVPHEDVGTSLRARMMLVTHTAQTYARLTARENMDLFADLRRAAGVPAAATEPLLVRLGLGHASDRLAGTFSRGMLQRLALARALIGSPELLLLDEPFTALDRPGRALLAEVLRQEAAAGTAILLSSHDVDAVLAVTDRVVLLEDGAIAGEARRQGRDDAAQAQDYDHRVRLLVGRMPETVANHEVAHA